MFKFSAEVRKVIYTTNAIESLNSGYRRLNRQRSMFPTANSLLKALYLATAELTKKWTMPYEIGAVSMRNCRLCTPEDLADPPPVLTERRGKGYGTPADGDGNSGISLILSSESLLQKILNIAVYEIAQYYYARKQH